ncbi:MAG: hypothetical protein WCF04_09740, partial [Candidatus Nanopelagicales bacterium]
NAPQGSAGTPTVSVTCEDGNFNVTVRGESSLPTFLGGLLGQSELHPAAQATAQVAGAPAYGGLRPYAICVNELTTASETTTSQSEFFKTNGQKQCDGNPPGNWGLVDFDGGSNANGDIANWTEHGYPDAIHFPGPMAGDPGANFNSSTVQNALDTIVGETVPLPVATKWTQSGGNNASFTAVGAVQVKVCGYGIKGKTPVTDSSCWNQTLYNNRNSNADLVIQWRYVAYPMSYDPGDVSGTSCSLSDRYCIPTIRLWQ